VDFETKKIIPVELKTMGDNRLYSNEIFEQLEKYLNFVVKYEANYLTYYKTLYSIKKRLKILPLELDKITSLDNYTVETKPLLLFGDCEQKGIDINHQMINYKIRSIGYGTYYYGINRADWSYIPGGVSSGTAFIRPDFPELLDWPYLWQQHEYVMGGGATNFMFLVLAADQLLEK
jgi:hypothetical protein